MIKEILTTILLSGSLAYGGVSQEIQSPKMSNYNDMTYTIVLEPSELDNKFINLSSYLSTHINNEIFNQFIYEELSYISIIHANTYQSFYHNGGYPHIWFAYESYSIYEYRSRFMYVPVSGEYYTLNNPLTLVINSQYYNDIKNVIELDIPHENFYNAIYDYFHDIVFNTESLDDYQTEFFGVNTSIRTWLSHTASLVSIVSVVILFISFIIMLVKMIGALFYNFGR